MHLFSLTFSLFYELFRYELRSFDCFQSFISWYVQSFLLISDLVEIQSIDFYWAFYEFVFVKLHDQIIIGTNEKPQDT